MQENKRFNKKNILPFVGFFCAIILLIAPLYSISYSSMKNRIYNDISHNTNLLIESFDDEMLMYHTIKNDFLKNAQYISMKSLEEFTDSSQYMILKNFSDAFSGRVNMMQLNSDVYIFFKNNNSVIGKVNVFDNIVPVFESYLQINSMNYDEFRSHIFKSDVGMSVKYVEDVSLNGEKQPSIIVYQPIDRNLGQIPEAVIVGIYCVDDLFSKTGNDDYKEMFDYVAVNDETVYSKKSNIDMRKSILTVCNNADLKFEVVISEGYVKAHMGSFKNFIWIYMVLLVVSIICLEIFLSRYMGKSLRKMIGLISRVTGDHDIKDEAGMLKAIDKLGKERKNYEKTFLMTLFLKPLENDECEFIRKKHRDFPEPYLFAVFYGEKLNVGILELLMNKHSINSKFILSPKKDVFVAFFEYTNDVNTKALRNSLDEMLFEAKSNGVKITALISIPCNGIEEFYYMYNRVQKYYRFVDYDGAFDVGNSVHNVVKKNDDERIYDKFKEMIMGGQSFEAKKIVYEEWYSVMTNNDVSDAIVEKVFYSQMGVIAEIALKIGYKGDLAQYSGKKKIDELAFSVADDVDAICELINSHSSQHSGDYEKVISFIDKNYNKLNFGIPDAENEFALTGKTINKIVKSCTGKTFTEYVETHRLKLAKKLLSEPDCEIKQVSEKCGFQNYDTFYKFFKKHTGTSPVKWRRISALNK